MVQIIGLIVACYVLPRLWETSLKTGERKPGCLRALASVCFVAAALLTLALLFSGAGSTGVR